MRWCAWGRGLWGRAIGLVKGPVLDVATWPPISWPVCDCSTHQRQSHNSKAMPRALSSEMVVANGLRAQQCKVFGSSASECHPACVAQSRKETPPTEDFSKAPRFSGAPSCKDLFCTTHAASASGRGVAAANSTSPRECCTGWPKRRPKHTGVPCNLSSRDKPQHSNGLEEKLPKKDLL